MTKYTVWPENSNCNMGEMPPKSLLRSVMEVQQIRVSNKACLDYLLEAVYTSFHRDTIITGEL